MGIVVTALLSNDATAVVLTPAVLAVVRRARVRPEPYLLACALIANAASFRFSHLESGESGGLWQPDAASAPLAGHLPAALARLDRGDLSLPVLA